MRMRLLSAWTLLPWLFRRATAVRVSLLVSYDGTSFRGWNDIRDTALRPALQRILAADTPPLLDASSRTDAGVHALGQVCAFSTPESATLDMDQLAYSLNQLLPDAVAVRRANAVADGFDPRSNSGKEYRYRLRVDMEGRAPLSRLYEWQIFRRRAAPPWDAAAAAAAAALCEGEHEFLAFTNTRRGAERKTALDPRCTLSMVRLMPAGDPGVYELRIQGDRFLYKMARNLAGALVKVGDGSIEIDELKAALLEGRFRRGPSLPITAPAHGLTLQRVFFGASAGGSGSVFNE